MTITQEHKDAALECLRRSDRDVAEVRKNMRRECGLAVTLAETEAALEALVAESRAVKCYAGGYVPYRPENGDTIATFADGRVYGVRCG